MAWWRTKEQEAEARSKRGHGIPWTCAVCCQRFKGGGFGAKASHFKSKHPNVAPPSKYTNR